MIDELGLDHLEFRSVADDIRSGFGQYVEVYLRGISETESLDCQGKGACFDDHFPNDLVPDKDLFVIQTVLRVADGDEPHKHDQTVEGAHAVTPSDTPESAKEGTVAVKS